MAEINKTEAVRRSLIRRKFLVENPPKGWLQVVLSDLAKQGLEVHNSVIYQQRCKLVADNEQLIAEAVKAGDNAPVPVQNNDFSFQDLLEVKQLVDKLGGVDAVTKAIEALKQLSV